MGGLGTIDGVLVTPEKIVRTPNGDIYHAMKQCSAGYAGFGETYFSFVNRGAVKAWKRHHRMTLNLVVPVGNIKFVIFDSRPNSPTFGTTQEVILNSENYCRLTIPPAVWNGFQGLGELNVLLNIADIQHDPLESDRLDVENDMIHYRW
jgi:dTDP-4-dehydrorhamnose 3,5-epimerase